jgi:hypothetical protein
VANLQGFDASKVEPTGAFEPLPAGDYPVVIIESAMKPTKNGQGQYLELKIQVCSGKYQNRQLFDRLNLVNSNDQAVQIAKGTLSAICRAVNVLTPNDSSELHLKKMLATVKVKPDQNGNPRNEISGYKPFTNMIEDAFSEPVVTGEKKSPF